MKSPNGNSYDERLLRLEEEVRQIKERLQSVQEAKLWWKNIIGSHKDDPVFDEILELGRRIRNRERLPLGGRKTRAKKRGQRMAQA